MLGTLLVIGNDLAVGKEFQQSPLAQTVTRIDLLHVTENLLVKRVIPLYHHHTGPANETSWEKIFHALLN